MPEFEDLPDKFRKNVKIHPESGCWVWSGPLTPKGYPVFRRRGAWKYAYELMYGEIPLHRAFPVIEGCEGGNGLCANPDHRADLPRDQLAVRHRCSVCKEWHDPQ